MKHHCTILATALAAAFSASAKTFDWPIGSPAAGARQFTAYHGETVRFNLQFRGAMTNLSPVAIYYQTNGMGKAEWFEPVPGTVFHPTNDCGATDYRFFILCNDPDGKDYTANGSLRLLDSPGFVPNEVPFPVKRIDFAQVEVLNPPWPGDSDIETVASNAAVRATSGRFRPFGDEYVYEMTGMSDFEYSGENADLVAALGTTQPYSWDDGDYVEYYFDELYVNDRYWWGYTYTTKNAAVVDFTFYCDYWDDDTGDYVYEEAYITGTREPGGWDRTNPVDTFAHQSEITAISSSITALRNVINGEKKILRTGKSGEYGTGYGYLQQMIDNETRRWRIRVPKFSSVTGMTTNSTASASISRQGSGNSSILTAPHTWLPGWTYARRLAETRGIYGSDAVNFADYRLGLFQNIVETNSSECVLSYAVTHESRSPMGFRVYAETNRLARTVLNGRTAFVRYVDYPQVHFRWQGGNNSTYTTTNENWITIKAIGVYDDARAATSNGTIPLGFFCLYDADLRTEQRNKNSGSISVVAFSVSNYVSTATVTINCNSATTLENVYAPYYRLVTTLNDENAFYYDSARNCTYRIAVTNGCFFTEYVMEGDWRMKGL